MVLDGDLLIVIYYQKFSNMKVAGLIGGLSWESTAIYYEVMNRKVQEILGGVHSCECLMYSFDLHEVAPLQLKGEWGILTEKMVSAAQRLERSGADFIVLCTNTMHIAAHEIASGIQIPFLHIVDPTAEIILGKSISKVGFIGTRFSMEQGFIRDRYHNIHHIETIIPEETDRIILHNIIYDELIKGIVSPSSKEKYQIIIQKLIDRGAQGIIAGCTEIEILLQAKDIAVPLFETSRLHAEKAVLWALA